MSTEVPDPAVFPNPIKEPFTQFNPVSETRPLTDVRLQAFKTASAGGVLEISERCVRKHLQGRRHLKRIKGWPCGQHANRTRAPIPGLLQGAYRICVISPARIAEHLHLSPQDVLENLFAGSHLLAQFFALQAPEMFVRPSVGAYFKSFSGQSPQLGVA